MSDLLAIGRSGVLAYQGALATVGENVTNADTTGYARRAVVLKESGSVAGAYTLNRTSAAFGGVQAGQVSRVWDQYLAANSWSAASDAGGAATRLQYLQSTETALGDSASGVGTKLTAVFTTATQLAAAPADTGLRQTMLAAVGDAATAIRQTDTGLAGVAGNARTQATTLVAQTNAALAALGKLNVALHTAAAGSRARAQLEDQRDQLVSTLAANVAIDTTLADDGAVAIKLRDYAGPTLLGATSSTPAFLDLQAASDGRLTLSVSDQGKAVAATPTGGALAGVVDAAATIAGRRQQLDGIAARLAGQLNGWQAGGLTPAGSAGQPLLAGTNAATLTLATGDPRAIAAGSASATDNGNLLKLSALRGSGGVESDWSGMVTAHALTVATAKTESDAAAARKTSADSALDATTGVSLDNEAAQLLRYQQAYSAATKIIQTARQTLQDLLSIV